MIINHNLNAMNAFRQFGINNANMAKSTEKLSSGLRINRAGDDAAGLAISEKMRGQIRGLDQASRNAQDGISLIQTAEGALNETHSILQRMRELAVQSSNDTNTDVDRKEIQKEITQLKDEIDRIANTTEFNTKKLLNGTVGNNATMSNNNVAIKTAEVVKSDLKADTYTVTQTNAATLGVDIKTNTTGLTAATFDLADTSKVTGLELGDYTLELKATGVANKFDVTLKNSDGVVVASAASWDSTAGGALTGTLPDGTTTKITLNAAAGAQEGKMTFNLNATYGAAGDFKVENSSGGTEFSNSGSLKITQSKFNAGGFEFGMTVDTALAAAGSTTTITTTNNALTMHIGANESQTMNIDINKMDTVSLGVKNIDVTTQSGAEAAISTIQKAIEKVSAERSKLGAFQNRLEHTINNLNTSSENLTASESRIRDTDMAKTVMENTKNSILAQAAQAMLAQANQQPQQVLQLLR
ncbi:MULTISPECIES: flagellin [Aneurinibacillus]|uniref:Flagellin n=1 Tax=Aneurinibacillus thermoaerophilus TaxID=143495 RepID=A0ABX8YA30_ANETH|nr:MULTISPECIES: flagellin [Aneurinibacillus]AMA71738.1 flagellin [Aneurinibacillus sp. XH2]MED0681392.1 flagellin [Aneurinibacillus thermoaerophilus]MED0738649.1 flagellin [Aneurinibacillus thermoaerophilus]MED0763306.1 flagellin [Aneurinibacillus thermoaerophilus]QYY42509.1 flagellin [Aneurinibacillus thermoaerophilus]